MDRTDREILACLQEDATMPVAEIARRVGLSSTPCWRRIQKLEESKVIRSRVALLDSQNGLLRDVQVSEGSLSASIVHPREVFRTAILEATAHLILVHNHPSGDPTPSKEDVHLTRQLVEGARLLGLRVHDHVIIGRGAHVSLAQRGLI